LPSGNSYLLASTCSAGSLIGRRGGDFSKTDDMTQSTKSFARFRAEACRDTLRVAVLVALAIAATGTSTSLAQSLMVGADGAVHLDEVNQVQAGAPVIIEQTPELIQPPNISGMSFSGMPMNGMPMGAPG
jgi:hypothetical protein